MKKLWELVDVLKQIVEFKLNEEKQLILDSRMYKMNEENYKNIEERMEKVFYDTLKKYIKIKVANTDIQNRYLAVKVLIEF